MSLIQVIIDDSTSKTISGLYLFDCENGGKLCIPCGSSFPGTTTAKEVFWRTDEKKLYRRNDGDTAWDAVEAAAAAHAASHKSGGGDSIKLDELAAPTDITTLDADTGKHGLLPKLGGGTSNFLRADGTWAAPPGGTDSDAIHDNVAAEISAITEKTTPVSADLLLIEDSAASNAKKRVQVGNLLGTRDASVELIIDGGGSAIETGIVADVVVPFACTIVGVTLLADVTGSIVVDIWNDAYGNYPPTVADTITASAKPTISSATKSQDTTLTGWTKTVAKGAILRINVDSCTDCARVLLSLQVEKAAEDASVAVILDGGGSAIETGVKTDVVVPFACTITGVTLLADVTGSIVIDIWNDTYANYPPTVADTIVASAKPTITTATKSQDVTLTGWTKAVAKGDILRINVDSCTDCTRVLMHLQVTKS